MNMLALTPASSTPAPCPWALFATLMTSRRRVHERRRREALASQGLPVRRLHLGSSCPSGRVRTSLSLAMRVLVVNIFMFTLFPCPNRHFFMPRVLLQEVERKALRFLTPHHMDQIGNVLGSRHIVWYTIIPSRFETVQCR